jgi:hypothetical protein
LSVEDLRENENSDWMRNFLPSHLPIQSRYFPQKAEEDALLFPPRCQRMPDNPHSLPFSATEFRSTVTG